MELPLPEILGIVVCLFFSGFFSSSETALTSLSDVKLEQIIETNKRWGRALKVWKRNPNAVLTTILIGNNIFNVSASALATEIARKYFSESGAIPIAVGAMTFLLLFFGEITPKTMARTYAVFLGPLLMNLVIVFHVLFYPFTWVLTTFVRLLIKVLGGGEGHPRMTEEDIEFIVSLGRRQGVIDKEKESLLSSIFEFTDTTVKEIMLPRTDLIAVPIDSDFDNLKEIIQQTGFSRIPVFEGSLDKIVGIFYTKSLISPPEEDEKASFLANHIRPPFFVPESKKISELLKMFQRERFHMAIVVDEFGGTEGVVTLEDIIEELLGEIHDEYDVGHDRLVKSPSGIYTADARIDIEMLSKALNIEFPEDTDYETLAGFLLEVSGEVPSKDWEHNYAGFTFRVTEADPQRVLSVAITPIQQQDSNLSSKTEEKPTESKANG